MSPNGPDRAARVTLVTLLLISIVLLAMLVAPFATPLFLAAVLAGVLYPMIAPLRRRLHIGAGFAAMLLTLGVLVALVVPIGWLGTLIVQEGVRVVNAIRDLTAGQTPDELLARLPAPLQGVAAWAKPRLDDTLPQLKAGLTPMLQSLAQHLPGWLARTGGFIGQAALMLLALYAMLTDGTRLTRWLADIVPLPPGRFATLLDGFRRIASAVLVSTLAIAGAQALSTLIGLLVVRAPQPVFFSFVAFLIALVPVLSPGLVGLGMAVALLIQGRWVAALVLAVWTLGVVMTIDNVLRPRLLQRGIGVPPTVLLFAVLGGVVVFGPTGIIAGPMVLSFFLTMVDMGRSELTPPLGADASATGATVPTTGP